MKPEEYERRADEAIQRVCRSVKQVDVAKHFREAVRCLEKASSGSSVDKASRLRDGVSELLTPTLTPDQVEYLNRMKSQESAFDPTVEFGGPRKPVSK